MLVSLRTPKPIHTIKSSCGWLLAVPLLCAACGSPQEPATSRKAADESTNDANIEPAAPELEPTATNEGISADSAEVAEPAADDANAIRDVVYKMVPGGLEIEVDGVKFLPKAEPIKLAGGAWGVKISMQAEAVGDSSRHLLKPKGGVLAFAGSVKRKGKEESFGDKREGDDRVELAPGETLSLESTWPKDKSQSPLWWGNDLTLEAGLWGLGKTPDGLRPVRQFFSLRMVAGNKPQPVLQPPKSAD